MRFLRFGEFGREKPAILDDEGNIRDISSLVTDIEPKTLASGLVGNLRALSPDAFAALPVVDNAVRIGAPVGNIGKVIAIGLNYADHAAESGLAIPEEPVVFMKAVTSIVGPNDPVVMPQGSQKSDWEVELAIVIGTVARNVDVSNALDHVAGYMTANDVSEREWQWDHGGTWDKGKGFDTYLPLGPWLVTADQIPDPQALDLSLEVNGTSYQSGNTRTMIFTCAEIISYVSRLFTLLPGDVIITGTPPGVGMGIKPEPVYLRGGDRMTVSVQHLGVQNQTVHEYDPALLPDFTEMLK
ncbi:fumarylacetoacetate hydrolase family protein [Paracoccus sp. N5]|uniref:fumarylacetoacetate hydrolase family protein n=1 Tax=Paracoccus sp. N5 TaxID=1101189 RepID=UPI000381208B|nr:fumarylacetoacetate hydrolase family protein [Paracoccus sp. N5]